MRQIVSTISWTLVAGLLAASTSAFATTAREAAYAKLVARFGRPTAVTWAPGGVRVVSYAPLDFRRVLADEIAKSGQGLNLKWEAAHMTAKATIRLDAHGNCGSFTFDTNSYHLDKASDGDDGQQELIDRLTAALPCR